MPCKACPNAPVCPMHKIPLSCIRSLLRRQDFSFPVLSNPYSRMSLTRGTIPVRKDRFNKCVTSLTITVKDCGNLLPSRGFRVNIQHHERRDFMEKESILEQLMKVRIDGSLGQMLGKDAVYAQTSERAAEYCTKLDGLHLPPEVSLLIDRYASAQVANGARYGELAYMLGFSDCTQLFSGRFPLP